MCRNLIGNVLSLERRLETVEASSVMHWHMISRNILHRYKGHKEIL